MPQSLVRACSTFTNRLLLVASLAVSACGGGDSRTEPSSAPGNLLATSTGIATFNAPRSNYTIVRTGSGWTATDRVGADGIRNVSSTTAALQFTDVSVNLGIGAKSQTISDSDLRAISELYVAFFNRVPDADGLSFWIDQFKNGMTLGQMCENFYAAAIQYSNLTGYAASMSNADFVKIIYKNVLGRPSVDADGLQFWTTALANGQATRGSLVASILNSAHTFKGDPTWGWVADLLDNKYSVAKYFAVRQGLNYSSPTLSVTNTMAIAAAITPLSTSNAIQLIGNNDVLFSTAQLRVETRTLQTAIDAGVPQQTAAAVQSLVSSVATAAVGSALRVPGGPGTEALIYAIDSQENVLLAALSSNSGTLSTTSTALVLVRMAADLTAPQEYGFSITQVNSAITGDPSFPQLVSAISTALRANQVPLQTPAVLDATWLVTSHVIASLPAAPAANGNRFQIQASPVVTGPTTLPYYFWNSSNTDKTWVTDLPGTANFAFNNRTFLAWSLTTDGGASVVAPPMQSTVGQLFAMYAGSESVTVVPGTALTEKLKIAVGQNDQTRIQNATAIVTKTTFAIISAGINTATTYGFPKQVVEQCAISLTNAALNTTAFSTFVSSPTLANLTAVITAIPFNPSAILNCLEAAGADPTALSEFLSLTKKTWSFLNTWKSVYQAGGILYQFAFDMNSYSGLNVTLCKTNGVFAPCTDSSSGGSGQGSGSGGGGPCDTGFNGTYAGTYSGSASGPITMTLTQQGTSTTTYAVTGSLTYGGEAFPITGETMPPTLQGVAQCQDESTGSVFTCGGVSGTITLNSITGTWTATDVGQGTLSLSRTSVGSCLRLPGT